MLADTYMLSALSCAIIVLTNALYIIAEGYSSTRITILNILLQHIQNIRSE
jgi:hypothetical protein